MEAKELPKNWEGLLGVSGCYVDSNSKVDVFKGCFAKEETKNIFPTRAEAEACLALSQLCQLRDQYNDGWKPDWTDDTKKHIICIHKECIYSGHAYGTKYILSFKTEELRDEFLENFRDLIKTAKPLL